MILTCVSIDFPGVSQGYKLLLRNFALTFSVMLSLMKMFGPIERTYMRGQSERTKVGVQVLRCFYYIVVLEEIFPVSILTQNVHIF